jgi:hypothetical protein
MPIDIRVPIGVMLGLMGALLAGYGLLGDQTIYARSLNLNINLIWGGVLVVTAAILLFLGDRRKEPMNNAACRWPSPRSSRCFRSSASRSTACRLHFMVATSAGRAPRSIRQCAEQAAFVGRCSALRQGGSSIGSARGG